MAWYSWDMSNGNGLFTNTYRTHAVINSNSGSAIAQWKNTLSYPVYLNRIALYSHGYGYSKRLYYRVYIGSYNNGYKESGWQTISGSSYAWRYVSWSEANRLIINPNETVYIRAYCEDSNYGSDAYWVYTTDDSSQTGYTNKRFQLEVFEATHYVWIYSGSWKKAIPYIYYNNKWNQAIPYVYNEGWKQGASK